jgi:hypothetical protein
MWCDLIWLIINNCNTCVYIYICIYTVSISDRLWASGSFGLLNFLANTDLDTPQERGGQQADSTAEGPMECWGPWFQPIPDFIIFSFTQSSQVTQVVLEHTHTHNIYIYIIYICMRHIYIRIPVHIPSDIHICIYTHIYIHIYLSTYIDIYILIYVYRDTYLHIDINRFIHIYYTHNNAYIYTCMHACIHAYIHPCMHACIHASIHPYIHPSIHPYILSIIWLWTY